MKFFAKYFLVGIIVALVGCSKSTFVDPSWTESPKLVKVVFTEPDVEALDDLQDDLPEYVDNFSEWFSAEFVNKMNEYSKDGVVFNMVMANSVGGEKVSLNDETFKAPKVDEMSDDADVYLVLDKIWFGRNCSTSAGMGVGVAGGTAAGSGGSAMGFGATTSCSFDAMCKFSFYDTKTKKLVSYGKAKGASSYILTVSKSDWKNAVQGLVYKLVGGTPVSKF